MAQLGFVGRLLSRGVDVVRCAITPASGSAGVARGLLADLLRSKQELLVENAMLRQQLIVAARKLKRPQFRPRERLFLVALASMFTRWRDALVLVKPETLLRWHRQGFRLIWTWRSRANARPRSRLAAELIALIRRIATENRLWGAERIRGELLKLGYAAAKSTIQRYISRCRGIAPDGQRWSTFLRKSGRGHLVLRLIRGARPLVSLPLRLRGDASPVAANVARSLDDSADGGLADATTATTHAVRR